MILVEICYLLGRRDAAEGARVEEGARGAGLQSGQVVHADDVEVGLTLQEKDSCGSERKGGVSFIEDVLTKRGGRLAQSKVR